MVKSEEFVKLHNRQIIDFSVSKDDKRIAYVYGNLDLPHSLYMNDIKEREIRFFDFETNIECDLRFKGFDQHSPSFSHDGKKLAFLCLINNKTQLIIYDFQKESIIFSTDLPYKAPNAFYGVLAKDIFWSYDDRYVITYFYENGIDHYHIPKDFHQSLLVIDINDFSTKEHLESDKQYNIYGFLDSTCIIYNEAKQISMYNIETNKIDTLKRSSHEVVKIFGKDIMFADAKDNRIYFGRNDEVLAEAIVEGELIKPMGISNDVSYAIYIVYKSMSVFLIKLLITGEVLYLSKENEVTYFKDCHAEPKCINKGIVFVKSSSKLHHEFFVFENNNIKQISHFNTTIVNKIDVDIIVDKYESGNCIIETPILLPKNYNKNIKYPLLIYIHGGPNSFEPITLQKLMSARGDSCAIQLCQEGFIVALPNYRGTRGYGEEHKEKVPRFSMEFSDFVWEDIRNCKKMLLSKYSVNYAKVGLYGTSYGAQIAGWIIANSNEYYAASGIIGVNYDEGEYSILPLTDNFICPFQIIETGMAEGRFGRGKDLHSKLLSSKKTTEYYLYPMAFHNGGWIDEYKSDYINRLTNFYKNHL